MTAHENMQAIRRANGNILKLERERDKYRDEAQRYKDALKRIVRDYQTPEQLQRNGMRQYGVPYPEVLEMAYENIQAEAATAIRRR